MDCFIASDSNVTYFDSSGVDHIPEEMKIGNKNIIKNIYRIQTSYSIMFGYFCIGFIEFMLKDKNLLLYTYYYKTY